MAPLEPTAPRFAFWHPRHAPNQPTLRSYPRFRSIDLMLFVISLVRVRFDRDGPLQLADV